MAQRQIVFSADSLFALLIHYSDGESLPLDAELKQAGFSSILDRYLMFEVASDKWKDTDTTPLHIRYEGQKLLNWRKGDEIIAWKETPDAPKIL